MSLIRFSYRFWTRKTQFHLLFFHLQNAKTSLNWPNSSSLHLALGVSVSDVGRQFNCHRNTVLKLRQRYEGSRNVGDRPRADRPRLTMWSRVLFSNLFRFNLSTADKRIRVFRQKVERFAQNPSVIE